MKGFVIIGMIIGALAATELAAWWWMHPSTAGTSTPVLSYTPQNHSKGTEPMVPLPDLYNKAAPLLHCSTGSIYHVSMPNEVSLHFAYFEWNRESVGSIFEAFRHMPESCMGSIGMTLVSKETPRTYQVGGEILIFDHTVFSDKTTGPNIGVSRFSPLIHVFKAVWVSGMPAVHARDGFLGYQQDELRQARLKSAITRFSPTHARVIQGAIRGASSGQAAWDAFKEAMLSDLRLEKL